MNRTMQRHWCRMRAVSADRGDTRVLEKSGQVHIGPVHGQDQCRVWHIIGFWFRAGHDKGWSWTIQIQAEAGSGQGSGQAQYKAGQAEPIMGWLEPAISSGTMQAHVTV